MDVTDEMKKGIEGNHVVVEVCKEITIEYQIVMPADEVNELWAMANDTGDAVRDQIQDLYFGMGLSERQVSEQLTSMMLKQKRQGVSKSAVNRYVQRIRKDMKKEIKQDIRANKKVFDKMMKLVHGLNLQKQFLWKKQLASENEMDSLQRKIDIAIDKMTSDQYRATVDVLRDIVEPLRAKKAVWDIQESVHHLLRQNMLAELEVLNKFGLCGKEAIEVVMSGGIDVDIMVTQMKEHYIQVQNTILEEVTDEDTRKRVFGRMAVLIKQLSEDDKWTQQ